MKLYFEDRFGEKRELAAGLTEEECMKEIHKFCEDHCFHIYYSRSWMTDFGKQIDVGSHSEFFYIKDED